MKTTLGQFCINVSDIERSKQFYEEVIGLTVQHRIEEEEFREVVLGNGDSDEGARIQLAQHKNETGPIDQANAFWKLYVYTDDCKGLYDRAIAAGSESLLEPMRLEKWPVTAAFVTDPDGYKIEILQNHDD